MGSLKRDERGSFSQEGAHRDLNSIIYCIIGTIRELWRSFLGIVKIFLRNSDILR